MNTFSFAVRSLLKSPGFTGIAILTLALGIGANTAMFSLLNTLMLRPVPLPDADQVVQLYRTTNQNPRGGFSPADYQDLPDTTADFGSIAAVAGWGMSLSEPGQPADMVNSARISANFFPTAGVAPFLGRGFRTEEETFGNHRVLIISHPYWQDRFAADPDIVGRVVRVDGESHEIVGVLPATFDDRRFFGQVKLFRPLGFNADEKTDRNSQWVGLIGRRNAAVSAARGEAFIANLGTQFAADHPTANQGAAWRAVPLEDTFMNDTGRSIVGMLVGLSSFVMLIACSNLANLLLARTISRSREFAVRGALGASRGQLLRPLIAESLLLALVGGACAILVAIWTGHWLTATIDTGGNGAFILALDWRVLGFAALASLVTALAFGLAPALFALRLDINGTLKSGARGSTGSRGSQRVRSLLIVGQFGLAFVLLAGAGMFMQGTRSMLDRHYGWDADNLLTGTVLLPAATYPGAEEIEPFQRQVIERLESLPGVESASLSYAMPFFGFTGPNQFLVEGQEIPVAGQEPGARVNGITPHYFATTGTPVLAGRTFTDNDTLENPKVVVINESMARGLFGEENPIGRRLARAGTDEITWMEIVGVVANTQNVFPEQPINDFQIYHPMAQEPWHYSWIALRTRGVDPVTLIEPVRQTMTQLNADLPVRDLMPAEDFIARATSDFGLINTLLGAFALLGLALASLGIYGVIARTVAQRTGEFGIRMALGAQVGNIVRLVLKAGLRLALIGATLGLLGALGLSRLLATMLPRMDLNSSIVIGLVTVGLVIVALVACYLPARKAARIDPVKALHTD
ncbi:ABC transporter permease [Synoicihabitans lomoniglobus]|uniref:ABC transporter permease n=1 Tax=Synoicihabitans lomoniglobus TaxID=2909285 RepID=A0AAF0CPL4_9BACT|nr:ABC transporter permease [Opitutaceae bacterium LMO-M01]WED65359.1 ABC transporter permease [Opitutaceae bacterium LMO-M01]